MGKLSDADAELRETEHWVGFALKHGYLLQEQFDALRSELAEIGRMLGGMMAKTELFALRPSKMNADI